MSLDVIVSWPRSHDYPLWRQFIHNERKRFNRVIAVLTIHSGRDYTNWLRDNCPEIEFIESPLTNGDDWRDIAVNTALDISTAERIWFTEQDFFITGRTFWDNVNFPLVGVKLDDRPLHPACIFINRGLIDWGSTRYFGPDPVDHFHTFGGEVTSIENPVLLKEGFFHYQGTTQNHALLERGQAEDIFRPEQFYSYLSQCLAAEVPLEETWKSEVIAALTTFSQGEANG